jgi:hypothetical protein
MLEAENVSSHTDQVPPKRGVPLGRSNMQIYRRREGELLEGFYEKPVITPAKGNVNPTYHAWADALFATDIMAEHGTFFALLMPPELAPKERAEALAFAERFKELHHAIDAGGPPQASELKRFANDVVEEIKPFVDYKARLGQAQTSGSLRSLVWPCFFDHTRREAERWQRRLTQLSTGSSEFERDEVVPFWTEIMDEHCRFVAHLLDPDEFELIDTAMKTSEVFAQLNGHVGGSLKAVAKEPMTVVKSLIQNPEMDEVLSAAETILDFKTMACRGIEAARIKSIIDPRLSDHVRREALKFVDELRRLS